MTGRPSPTAVRAADLGMLLAGLGLGLLAGVSAGLLRAPSPARPQPPRPRTTA